MEILTAEQDYEYILVDIGRVCPDWQKAKEIGALEDVGLIRWF